MPTLRSYRSLPHEAGTTSGKRRSRARASRAPGARRTRSTNVPSADHRTRWKSQPRSVSALRGRSVFVASRGRMICLTSPCDRRPCPGRFDLLRLGHGWCSECSVVGDAVAVSVGGDHSRSLAPYCCPARVARSRTERSRPGCVGGESAVEDGIVAVFDERFSLVERGAHLTIAHAVCVWDETSDEPRCFAGSSRSSRS